MILVQDLTLFFGTRPIFDEISFNIIEGQKIGLVGINGSGKTTLLKILAGIQGYDSGKIIKQNNLKLAFMPQDIVLLSQKSILQEAFDVFKDYIDFDLESERLLAKTKKILVGLGFKQEEFDNKVDSLSVGWKMRLVLAKLLLQEADLYLFDEPTNHLDIVAKDWFVDFLKYSKFSFVLVSHDKYFLDSLCNYIFELDRGKLNLYTGNYSKYIEQKEQKDILLEKKFIEQQRYIKKQTETIERFRAKASKAKMAQSMLKALEKLELIELSSKPKVVRFSFPDVKRTGDIVLRVENLSKTFDNKTVFKNVTFEIKRGQKVALVAANGMGKTTLLNLIIGKYKLETGKIILGHNVEFSVFEQDQNKSLNLSNTILQEIEDSCKTSEQRMRVRSLLGSFLFPGDDVDKKIAVLSGGEMNRVAMVKVLLQNSNFLILDEPTNHLDIYSKEILLQALKAYTGTILFVSHDRIFLNSLADHIIELTSNGVNSYVGDYDAYLYQKECENKDKKIDNLDKIKIIKTLEQKDNLKKDSKVNYFNQKKLKSLELKIEKLEKEKEELYLRLPSLEYSSKDYKQAFDRINQIELLLKELYLEWESLV